MARLDHQPRYHVNPMPSGEYVRLSVSDIGCGMSSEVQEHMFRPFCTTKGRRKGNGTWAVDRVGHRHGKRRWIGCTQREWSGDTFRYIPPARCMRDRGADKRVRTVAIDRGP
ncbi:MAG: hypothetical protein CV088_06395 [Nitrospira sp. LK70]|nr:hypothetical protein [Nitrospira sp. LK70]